MRAMWTTLGVLFALVAADGPDPSPIKARLAASAPAIDRCVARYILEQPAAKGTAKVGVAVDGEGKPLPPTVETALPQPRDLLSCLWGVARAWPLEGIAGPGANIQLTVPVYAGARFSFDPPPTPPAPEAPARPLGSFTFAPGSFSVGTWGTKDEPGSKPAGETRPEEVSAEGKEAESDELPGEPDEPVESP